MSTDTDLLRRAAVKIRDTANASAPGPWALDEDFGHGPEGSVYVWGPDGDPVAMGADWSGAIETGHANQTAAHVALWHPQAALAVAAWLDVHAEEHASYDCYDATDAEWVCQGVRAARAILGEGTTQ